MVMLRNAIMSALSFTMRLLEVFHMRTATAFANHLWLRPVKMPMRDSEKKGFAESERLHVSVRNETYHAYRWGKGPTIMMVHGWDGRGSQMLRFVRPLVKRGYSVVAFDVPAHGDAPGNQVDPPLAAEVITAVARQCTAIEGVITHSFGAIWALLAVTNGIPVKRIAMISPPQSLPKIFEKFARRLRVSPRLQQSLKTYLERTYGDLWNNFSPEFLVGRLQGVNGLVVHDQGDREIPVEEGRRVAELWADADYVETSGLGHYRILKSDDVIDKVVGFVTGRPKSADGAQPSGMAAESDSSAV